MMKFLLLLIVLFHGFIALKGQDFVREFGKYSGEEFKMESYPKDTSAEAVVIYDIGKATFDINEGLDLIFERRTKIKIFKKSGYKYAQFEIPYYVKDNKMEDVYDIEGNTYNLEDGRIRISQLDTKTIYKEKTSDNWFVMKVAMPDVKEGSIVEIRYKIMSPYIFNYRSWEFQNKIPVIYSEYEAHMIPFYEYTYILQGANRFDSFDKHQDLGFSRTFANVKFQDMVYNFVMKDLPAFKDEAFITSYEDFIVKLDFQLAKINHPEGYQEDIMTTWPKLVEELLDNDNFGKYYNNCAKRAKDIVDTMSLSSLSPLEQVQKIERFVKSNFKWNGYYDKFTSKTAKEFLNSKIGNSTDINLFLAGMLKAAGIGVCPVIISTRNHGKVKIDYPFHHFFNYALVYVQLNNVNYLLDATTSLSNFAEIPTRCINDKGLLIKKTTTGTYDMINVSSSTISNTSYYLDYKLNETKDSIKGKIIIKSKGYDALESREEYIEDSKKMEDNTIKHSSFPIDSLVFENIYDLKKPFVSKMNFSAPIGQLEDKILISPFLNFAISENPLKQPFRTYPVDMNYRRGKTFIVAIHIPEKYEIVNKPKDVKIENDDFSVSYKCENIDSLTVQIVTTYEFKKAVYGISSYFDIKKAYNTIVSTFNEKIVLRKL